MVLELDKGVVVAGLRLDMRKRREVVFVGEAFRLGDPMKEV